MVEVKEMTDAEATQLLLNTAEKGYQESSQALPLVVALGKIPLVIELAGANIRETQMSIEGYKQLVDEDRAKLLNLQPEREITGYRRSITTAWNISYKEIGASAARHNAEYALDLLHFLSHLHSQYVPIQVLKTACRNLKLDQGENLKGQVIALVGDNSLEQTFIFATRKAVKFLAGRSLISVRDTDGQPSHLSMHPIIHQWAREATSEKDRLISWYKAVLTMAAALKTKIPRKFHQELVPHIDHLTSLYSKELFEMPCGTLGCLESVFSFSDVFSSEAGFPHKASKLRTLMSKHASHNPPDDGPRYAQILQQLARTHSDLGEYNVALNLQHKAVNRLAVSYSMSLLMLSIRNDLSDSFRYIGKHDKALEYQKQTSGQFSIKIPA